MRGLFGGHEPGARPRREVRVEQPADAGRDLGHQFSANRDEPVASPAEPEAAPPHRALVVGLGPVLVEERGPRLRLHPQFVGAGAHRARVACAEGRCDEFALGGADGPGRRPAGAVELAHDHARGVGPEFAVGERRRDPGNSASSGSPVNPSRTARRRAECDASPGLGARHLGDPLEEFCGRAASAARRQPLTAQLDPRTLTDLAGARHRCASMTRPTASIAAVAASNSSSDHPAGSSNPRTSRSDDRTCSSASTIPFMVPSCRDPLTFDSTQKSQISL